MVMAPIEEPRISIEQTVSAAIQAMLRGAFAEAEAHCFSVLEIHPNHFLATLVLADVMARAGRVNEALPLFDKAAAINPGNSIPFTRAAIIRFRRSFGAPATPRPPPPGVPRIQMTSLGANGRFGNQLLQYAIVRRYAEATGLTAEFPDWIGRDLYDLDDPLPSATLPTMDEKSADIFSALREGSRMRYSELDVRGYFCNDMSGISPHKEAIRAFFAPGRMVSGLLDGAIQQLRSVGRTIVAVHLRRSDFGYGRFWVAPASWYAAWLERLWPKLDAPVLYVATDDRTSIAELAKFSPWDSDRLKVAIPGAEFLVDHHVLRNAEHIAISNSSFSFTAAMLNSRAATYMRPDSGARELISFDPWASAPLLHPNVPSDAADSVERKALKWYFANGETALHLGQYCAPWTNLARSVHEQLTVLEAGADTSVDQLRREKKLKHLRHLIVEDAKKLPDIIRGARHSLAHARIDMIHFSLGEVRVMSEALAALRRDGYVLLCIENDGVVRLDQETFGPGHYMAIQERLLPLMSREREREP